MFTGVPETLGSRPSMVGEGGEEELRMLARVIAQMLA